MYLKSQHGRYKINYLCNLIIAHHFCSSEEPEEIPLTSTVTAEIKSHSPVSIDFD